MLGLAEYSTAGKRHSHLHLKFLHLVENLNWSLTTIKKVTLQGCISVLKRNYNLKINIGEVKFQLASSKTLLLLRQCDECLHPSIYWLPTMCRKHFERNKSSLLLLSSILRRNILENKSWQRCLKSNFWVYPHILAIESLLLCFQSKPGTDFISLQRMHSRFTCARIMTTIQIYNRFFLNQKYAFLKYILLNIGSLEHQNVLKYLLDSDPYLLVGK